MTAPEVELRDTWHHLAGRSHDLLLHDLLGRHREPHRRYHTATHVMWVLRHVAQLAPLVAAQPPAGSSADAATGVAAAAAGATGAPGAPFDLAAVQLAALYHDAIYDPRRTDNEARSAELAASVAAQLGWQPSRCALVGRLVVATAHFAGDDTAGSTSSTSPAGRAGNDAAGAAGAAEEAVLLDADLAILGAEPSDYMAYARGVRGEYAHVPEAQWRSGRAGVLRSLLATQPLYRTAHTQAGREARASANLAAELATLVGR